jgi:hypothetical protein
MNIPTRTGVVVVSISAVTLSEKKNIIHIRPSSKKEITATA